MGIYDFQIFNFAGEKRVLNSELWHACAGPLVSLPAVGSRVVYFPQGHSEQVSILNIYIFFLGINFYFFPEMDFDADHVSFEIIFVFPEKEKRGL